MGLLVAAVLAVLALSALVYLFTRNAQDSGSASGPTTVTSGPSVGPSSPSTGTPSEETATTQTSGTETGGATDTATGATSDTATESVPSPTAAGVVQLDPGLVGDPAARSAATTLSAFFTAITERRFRDAYALYTTAARRRLGSFAAWSAGYATTRYDGITLTATDAGTGGAMTAHVTFTSHQSPRDAPDRSSECLVWDLAYRMVPAGGATPLRIDRVESDAPAGAKPFHACP